MKTLQECADIIAKHFLNQREICRKPYLNLVIGPCLFLDEDTGNKCAFVVLIPKEKYSPAFEGHSLDELCVHYVNFLDSLDLPSDAVATEFFCEAQSIHDDCWDRRNEKFKKLCDKNSLQYNPN